MSKIDLSELTATRADVRTLSGQERGAEARARFHLDELDERGEVVEVVVPTSIETISPSFLQGMLTKSIFRSGNRESFLRRYRFEASKPIKDQIDDVIARVLAVMH